MFKNSTEDSFRPRRIPLTHIDQIKSNVKNLTKIQVKVRNDFKLEGLFEIGGESPVFIAKLCKSDDERLYGVNIKAGDYIMAINEQNVSRASAKSVKKIIRSSSVVSMTLYRPDIKSLQHLNTTTNEESTVSKPSKFNSLLSNLFKKKTVVEVEKKSLISSCIGVSSSMNKNTVHQELTAATQAQVQDNDSIDGGYYSIPRTNSIPNTNSLASDFGSSTSSIANSKTSEIDAYSPVTLRTESVIQKFKSECEYFLGQIQQAVDVYVRPTIVLQILSIDECLNLYQNIEKLIPVTKFMQNILSSCESNDLPNTDLLTIVFDSFKTYLLGLPNAINLLGELTSSNQNFVDFIQNLKDSCEFKILDLLFMPLNFVQLMVEFLRSIQKNGQENVRFGEIMMDLYQCSLKAHQTIEEAFNRNVQEDEDLSDFFSQLSTSTRDDESNVSSDECGLEKVAVKVRLDGDHWSSAYFMINKMRIEFTESEWAPLNLNHLSSVKSSKNAQLVHVKLIQSEQQVSLCIKFESECLRNYLYEKMMSKLL